jgi:uncharacterized protein (DUF305 family)
MRQRTNRAIGTLLVMLALTSAGCGSDDSESGASTEVSTTKHNDADVVFATDMIQHHAQALSMVDLTLGRPMGEDALRLAEDIRAAQGPEVETMTDWLTDWDEEVPETMRDHANAGEPMEGMDHGDSEMPGMMSAEEMAALADAQDIEFEPLWLKMMIDHHEGAIEMAETQMRDGQYKPAVDLASNIVVSQAAEIDEMRALLGE